MKSRFYHPILSGLLLIPAVSSLIVAGVFFSEHRSFLNFFHVFSVFISGFSCGLFIWTLNRYREHKKIIHIISVIRRLKEGDFSARFSLNKRTHDCFFCDELNAAVELLEKRTKTMNVMASTDFLTKALNRQTFINKSHEILMNAVQENKSFTLVLIDIDFFKSINDNFGHIAGDKVLRETADLCRKLLRHDDLFARYGGEEFIVLLPRTTLPAAFTIAERLRTAVENHRFSALPDNYRLTISLGVVVWKKERLQSITQLIERADQALYYSKEHGRNLCSVF
jgi:diguanylate cyclase (GGDEF)-like protein